MDLDITQNIRKIETLKVNMLSLISKLYEDMLKLSPASKNERKEILAQIILTAYLLSYKLGDKYEDVDEMIIKNLRLEILNNKDELNYEVENLLKHINGHL